MRKKICFLIVMLLCMQFPIISNAATPQFTDIKDHWAKDYITNFAKKGFIQGYADQTFRPDKPTSRAEFTCMLLNCLTIKTIPDDTNAITFSDTVKHWAHDQIEEAVRRGILIDSEYINGFFKPNEPIGRDEVAAMMIRAMGKGPDTTQSSFKDPDQIAKSIYSGYIKASFNEGLLHGYTDGTFRPFQSVKRAEACVMLTNLLGKTGAASNSDITDYTSTSSDFPSLVILGNRYNLEDIKVYSRQDMTHTPIYSLSMAENTIRINSSLTYQLNSSSNNPDLVVNNMRYINCRISVNDNELQAVPDSVGLDSVTFNDSKYNADYVKIYVGDKNSDNYLSDAEIVDQQTVKIAGRNYDISDIQISIALGGDFYAIKGINKKSGSISLDLEATTPVVIDGLDLSDISAFLVDNHSLNLDTIGSLFFIIDGSRYELSEVIIDASGDFTVDNVNYNPDQVVIALDNYCFYDIKNIKYFGGKFSFYCTESDITNWALINGKYQDASKIKIFMGSKTYSLNSILVVKHNVIRIGAKQYNLSSSIIGCSINGVFYNIEDIDYVEKLDMVEMDVTKSTDNWNDISSQPTKYVFYLDDSIFQDGANDDVNIYAGGKWITFDSLTFSDQSHFEYDNETYNLDGANIKINNIKYSIIDVAWRVNSRIMEIYLEEV